MVRALGVLLLVLTAAGCALAGAAGDARFPQITALKLPQTPTMDGRLGEGEWAQASRIPCFSVMNSEVLIPRQPAVWVGWNDAGLLVGAEIPLPPGEKAKATATDWDGTVWADDCVEIHLDPTHEHGKNYQFVVNALGTRFDALGGDKAYTAQWEAAAVNAAGKWSCEFFIPWPAIGATVPEPGRIAGLNVGINAGWLGGTLTWSPVQRSLHDAARYGHLRLATDAALCILGLSPGCLADVQARALGSGEIKVTSSLLRRDAAGGEQEIATDTQTLSAPATLPLPLRIPTEQGFPQVGRYAVRYSATGSSGLLLSQRGEIEVGPALSLTAQAFIHENYLQLAAGPDATVFPADQSDVVLSLSGPLGQMVEEKPARDSADGQYRLKVDGARLPAGTVTIRAVATNRQTGATFTAEKVLNRPLDPVWLNTREGLAETVPAPWTPLEVLGDAVLSWGRTYRFTDSVLPTEVVTRDASILAGAITLSGEAGGKPLVWQGDEPVFADRKPTVVSLTGDAVAEGLSLKGTATIEYDGMVRVDLTLTPAGQKVTVKDLTLEVPLKPQHARYLYHFPGQWGSVANSGYLPLDGWTHAFKPFLWLGDEDRGLSWFCESDRDWYPLDSQTALTIERQPSATLLRCRLIQGEIEISRPLQYTFGFQATPVKQPEKTVWDYRITHHGAYGLEDQPASLGGAVRYPAEGHINPGQGTIECWYRPAFENTERDVPFAERKQMTNFSIITLKWDDDMGGGTNCGLYWNAHVQGPVAWSRKEGKVTLNPGAPFDWKTGQWYHLALTWGDVVRLYVDGEMVAEAPGSGFIPAPLEQASIIIGGPSAQATVDELRILSVARPPAPAPGRYEPDAETLLLDHFEEYGDRGAVTAGLAEEGTSFGPGKFGNAVTWDPTRERKQLQHLAQLGVRTICFHEHWSPYQSYPTVTEENAPRLRSLIDGCHSNGINLLLYMSRQFADNAPEWELYHDEVLQTPNLGGYQREPRQTAYVACWNNHWREFCLHHLGKLIAEYGNDGWYLDGPEWPMACSNQHHGCGYTAPDGSIRPTWDIFATRDFMKRLYVLTRQRKPEGQLNIHNSTVMVIPTLGWGTSSWGGEQIDAIKPPVETLDIMPLDAFRTEFMGRQWGVPSEFLVYDGQPYYARDVLAYTLLHGVLIRPSGTDMQARISALWKVHDEFPLAGARMYPYWDTEGLVQCAPKGVHATAYERPGEGLLLFVSNLSDSDAEARVTVSKGKLGWTGELRAWDAFSREPVELQGQRLSFPLGSWQYRVIRLK